MFGYMIENAGFGYYNSQSDDIDVASTKYTEKMKKFWNDWISKYKVNYYKLDGWLFKPCENKEHDHIVGGIEGIYEYVDYWERYIDVFQSMRETASNNKIDNLWLSLVSYINPSPFHLQWANSIWIQLSNDIGYIKLSDKDSYADQMLNYRDNVYNNFYHIYQFQLPPKTIFNYDPIYGKAETKLEDSLNDDEFRKYLLMCGMRGTSLFELYYSYTMMNEGDKWYINSEVLNYIQNRHSVLQHSKIFGNLPEKGNIYGYSAWSNDRGTIAIRNPSNEIKVYTIKLNQDIGVPKTIGTIYRKIVLDFNSIENLEEGKSQKYGDEIKVTLQPREVRIIDFEPNEDKQNAKIEVIKAINQKEIQIRFNKKIRFNIDNYLIDEVKIQEGKLRGDLRTVSLYLKNALENNTDYYITFKNVKDSVGNVLNTNVKYTYMAGNMIVNIPNEIGPVEEDSLLSSKEYSVDSFTIHLNIKEIKDDDQVCLIKDDRNKVSVEIVNRKVKFSVHSISVLSKQEILLNKNVNISCVRERNTMLKIYINGEISQSNFVQNQKDIVSLKYIQICKSTVIFNSIIIASYGFSYKDVFELNRKIIQVKTALAEATSEQEGHQAAYAIDSNEMTYWFSKEGQDQSIKISFDRNVFIEKIVYIPHDNKTAINYYTISCSLDNNDWTEISGTWNKNNQKEAVIKRNLRFLILKGKSDSNIISASQIYFYGFEIENEDHNPTQPPPPSPLPTGMFLPTEEPIISHSDDNINNKDKNYTKLMIICIVINVIAIILIVLVIIIFVVLRKKKKSQENTNKISINQHLFEQEI